MQRLSGAKSSVRITKYLCKMKWSIEQAKNPLHIKLRLSGNFDTNAFSVLFDQLLSADFWRPGMPLLFDERRLDLSGVNYERMGRVSDSFVRRDAQFGACKIALLKKSIAGYGLGRQFQIITQDRVLSEFAVFIDESQAVEWLRLN